jgi:hypothetical protein
MAQSLALTEAFYEGSHAAIQGAWGKHRLLGRASVALWDYYTMALPLGDAWVHEEFHRAVMGSRGIDSFNDIYKLKLGAEAIAVSHVEDEGLVRLKREHPAEQARLGVAGVAQGDVNLWVVLHRYENAQRRFAGVDARVLDYPVSFGGRHLHVSPRAALWMQPRDQVFRTSDAAFGGLASLRVHRAGTGRLGTWAEVEAKTAGWVAGNVNLGANVSVRLGGSLMIP